MLSIHKVKLRTGSAVLFATASAWLMAATLGCGANFVYPPPPPDAGNGDSGTDGGRPDGDTPPTDGDARRDADDPPPVPTPGPAAMIVSELTVLAERVCDLDGIPPADNCLQSLGNETATGVAMSMTSFINARIRSAGSRFMVYFPWIDDLSRPQDLDTRMFMFAAEDEDGDRTDDLTGDEEFFARGLWLSQCGEGLFVAEGSIIDGNFSAEGGRLQLPFSEFPIALHSASIFGPIAPGGGISTVTLCGHVTARDLATLEEIDVTGRNFLELVIFPEQVLSHPEITGIQPDMDNDADGLEEFRVDRTTGTLHSCLDGDGTVFTGRDCWERPEMVDGFSFSMRLTVNPAVFRGCTPGWRDDATEPCTGGPVESRLCPDSEG